MPQQNPHPRKNSYLLAYHHWLRRFPFRGLDQISKSGETQGLKLRPTREALQLSRVRVANRMEISERALHLLEHSEGLGTITLGSMKRAAQAMDCELIYFFRPKSQSTLSALVWQSIAPVLLQHPWMKKCRSDRRPQALAGLVDRYFYHPKVRKNLGWNRNNSTAYMVAEYESRDLNRGPQVSKGP